jgi:hypothetical protein
MDKEGIKPTKAVELTGEEDDKGLGNEKNEKSKGAKSKN